jgi:hypothetical protein
MTSNSDVVGAPVSKELSDDFLSVSYPERAVSAALLPLWKWLARNSRHVLTRGAPRRLRVAETVSLGEKRFISILHVDGEQFLLGGSPSNIVLLAKLEGKPEDTRAATFENALSSADPSVVGRRIYCDNSAEVAR